MTTITVLGKQVELTTERQKRIFNSIVEFTNMLEKELAYSEDLQNKETIERYTNNINKLKAMLA